MIPFLAQTQPASFGDWTSNAFYVVGLITAVVMLYKATRSKPGSTEIAGQPLTVRAANDYATKGELRSLEVRVDRITDEVRTGFTELDRKRSSSIAGLHDDLDRKTNDLRKDVKEDFQGVHDRIHDVATAIGRVEGKLSK